MLQERSVAPSPGKRVLTPPSHNCPDNLGSSPQAPELSGSGAFHTYRKGYIMSSPIMPSSADEERELMQRLTGRNENQPPGETAADGDGGAQ